MNLDFYSLNTILEMHKWENATQAFYVFCLMEELSVEENQ